jgi:hypothetical protein
MNRNRNRESDPFLSDEYEEDDEEEEVAPPGLPTPTTQYTGMPLPRVDPSQLYTQRDYRRFNEQVERESAAAAAAHQQQIDAENAAYHAEQARIAARPSQPPITDFFLPTMRPPLDPLTPKQHAIARRVAAADAPVREQYVFYGNQQHAANAAEEAEQRRRVAKDFVTRTNAAQRDVEAREAAKTARRQEAAARRQEAAARRRGNGQGGQAQGGQRKSSKKKRKNTHKNKINKKKSRRRSRYY